MAMERRAPDDLQEAVAATLRRLRGELGPSPQPGMQRPPAVTVPANQRPANQRAEPTLPFGGPEPAAPAQPAQASQPAQPDLLSRAEAGSEIPPNPSQRLAELREVLARPDRAERARPRLLPYALSGMAVILFAGIGWWTYSSINKPQNSAQVPLVVADQTPEKVPPPANQAASEPTASSNKTIYNDVAPGTAPPPPAEVLLPAPTVPDVPATSGTTSDTNSGGASATGTAAADTGSTAAATSNGSAATDTGASTASQGTAPTTTSGSDLALTPAAPATGTTTADNGAGSTSGATSMSTTDTGGAAATTSQAPAASTTDTGSAASAAASGTGSTATATTTAENGTTGTGMTETLIPSASGTDTGTASSQTPEVAATGSATTSGTDTSGSAAAQTGTSDSGAAAPAAAAPAPSPAEVYDLSGAPASVPRLAPMTVSDAGNTAASTAALQPVAPEPATTQTTTSSTASTTTASTDTGASSATAAPATQAALGNFRIQLAALKTEADAKATWKRLSIVHSDLLGGLSYHIEKVALSSGTYYRLQAGPFADRAAAADVCVKLKAQGQQCLVKP